MTATNVVTLAQARYSEMDATLGLAYLNVVHRRLVNKLQIRNSEVDLPLVAAQSVYDLDTSIVKIWSAWFFESLTSYREMKVTSEEREDDRSRVWRGDTSQSTFSRKFYLTTTPASNGSKYQIGILPYPIATSDVDTGYPLVKIYCSAHAALSGSDTIPATLIDEQIYIAGIHFLFARDRYQADLELNKQLYDDEMTRNIIYTKNMPDQQQTTIEPSFPNFGRVI